MIARDQTERRGMEEKIRLYQNQLFSVASEMSALESRVEERERHLIASDLHDYVGQNLAVMTFMVGRLQQMLPPPRDAADPGDDRRDAGADHSVHPLPDDRAESADPDRAWLQTRP